MNFALIVYGVISVLLLSLVKFWFAHKRLREFGRKFDGPRGLPLLGILPQFLGKNNEEILHYIMELIKQYGSPVKVWVGPMLVLLVDHPEHLKVTLNSKNCLQKPYVYNFLNANFGLMVAPASMWKLHRKYLNTCFNPKFLQTFVPTFNKSCAVLTKNLENFTKNNEEFDIFHAIGKCTLEMICSTSLGINEDYQGSKGDRFMHHIDLLADTINQRIFNIFYHIPFIYKLSSLYRQEQTHFKEFHAVSHKVIQNANEKILPHVDSQDKSGLKKPCTFVEQIYKMLVNVDGFEDKMVLSHVDTLVAAGNETSALTISFAILMLAMHEDIQEQAIAEICEILKNPTDEVTIESLHQMKYLEMVINETLRLFPVTPFIAREVTEDLELEKELVVPKGALLMIPIFKIHRNPVTWGPDAELFKPNRFLPEEVEKRHPYCFIPFSNGLRNCIGWRYSMFAMKTTICHLLRNYRFSTKLKMSDLRLKMALDLKLVNKHMVSIERRTFVKKF